VFKQVSRIVSVGLALTGLVSLAQAQQQACVNALSDSANPMDCIEASSVPTMGMLYPISSDFYMDPGSGHVGLGITTPAARLHVNGDLQVAGEQRSASDIRFNDNRDGVYFSSVSAFFLLPTPMITMFTSGTQNTDRMVLAHSDAFDNWGLEYRDAEDQFVFRSATEDVLNIDLGGAVFVESPLYLNSTTRVDGPTGTHFIVEEGAELGIGTTGPRVPLDVNVSEAAAIIESTSIGPFQPVLQINGPSSGSYDFILAGRTHPGGHGRALRRSTGRHRGHRAGEGHLRGRPHLAGRPARLLEHPRARHARRRPEERDHRRQGPGLPERQAGRHPHAGDAAVATTWNARSARASHPTPPQRRRPPEGVAVLRARAGGYPRNG